ncbi:thiamine biosynthesis lipoprotein [Pedobacter sp. UYEF25]
MFKVFLFLLIVINFASSAQKVAKTRTTLLMGGRFDITIVANNAQIAENNIDTVISEISRIENLISDWKARSQVSAVNRNAGIAPVKVDRELIALTQRAIKLSEITNGAFDISFAAMDKIWKFDGSMNEMPSEEAIKNSVEKVGYKNIVVDSINSTIFLKRTGMKIGFGALGEGYAADRCREMMKRKGIGAGIVNASGDMSVWGKQPNGKLWRIGIANPFNEDTIFEVLKLHQQAAVTSGSYRKFVVLNGKRYSHIINPSTGYPATGLISVTVFGNSTEIANGLSTSVMVLGLNKGLKLLDEFVGYSYIIITDAGKVISSKRFKNLPKNLHHVKI